MKYGLILIIAIIFLTGCNTTSTQNNTDVNTQSTIGYLVDANVSGVDYYGINCDNPISGVTGSDNNLSGKFVYNYSCEYIEFKIGSIILGNIKVDDINKTDHIVFITDLAEKDRDDTNNSNVINVLRILQTLDEDENPFNGIFITEEMKKKVKHRLNYHLEDNLTSEQDLKGILTNNDINRTLISSIKSLVHFEDTLRGYNIDVDTVPPYKPYLSEIIKSTSNSRTHVELNGEKNSKICVNNSCDANSTMSLYENLTLDNNGYKLLELDTNMSDSALNPFDDFNITLIDDQNNTSEGLTFSIFKDSDQPKVRHNSIVNGIFSKTINSNETYIADLNITDRSLDHNLTLHYEIRGEDKDKISYTQPSTLSLYFKETQAVGTYSFILHVEDEARHQVDVNFTITVQ